MANMATEITTPDSLEYTYLPVTTGSMVFKVQAANDAHLALGSGPVQGNPLYEIFLGGWGNTKSAIRKNGEKPDKACVDTPNILSASEPRCFWVRWDHGNLVVGKEGQVTPFLEWKDPEPFGIGHFGICTGWGATGTWILEDGDTSKQVETPDDLQYKWHPVQQGCIKLEVRSPHNAHVALTCGPCDTDPMYELLLGGWENSASVIRYRREKPDKVRENTPSILSHDEYRSFCVAWKNGLLWVTDGRGNGILEWKHADGAPFGISHFGVRTAWGANGHWKVATFERPDVAPPSLSGPAPAQKVDVPGWAMDRMTSGVATWVEATHGVVPPNAVPAGFDQEQQYVARARHAGDIIPGKLVPSHQVCYVPWGGREHTKTNYQVLCNCNPVWLPACDGRIPTGALPAGETENGTETLFVGRASHNGVMCVGKVQQTHNVCYIPYGGKEVAIREYEVLCAQ